MELSYDQQSLLLIMSDLSGPAFRDGYETYLTGYPLPNSGFYCIGRTWFAPELPRPGCVWTHTFLIRNEDLPRISNFDQLNFLFTRPGPTHDFSNYQYRVMLDTQQVPPPRTPSELDGLIQALYGADKPVIVPSDRALVYESLVLAVIEQQWPRLRRGFRFCSGALSLRDTHFDLSVCPPEVANSMTESVLVLARDGIQRLSERWAEIAQQDLMLRHDGTDYRDFLWRFGPDQPEGRGAFRPLSEIYALVSDDSGEPPGEKLLSALNHFYPSPVEAGRLKTDLFGKNGRYNSRIGSDDEVMKLLISHPYATVVPDEAADIIRRSSDLVASDLERAVEIAQLAGQLGGENGERYLCGFFAGEEWSDDVLTKLPPTLLPRLLTKQPSLIGRGALWRREDYLSLIPRILPYLMGEDAALRDTLSAMMRGDAWNGVLAIIRALGARAIREVLILYDVIEISRINLPDEIYAALAEDSDSWGQLYNTGRLGPVAIKILTADLDPRAWPVRRLGGLCWSKALQAQAQFSTFSRTLRSAVFLLAIGLSSDGAEAVALVRHAFPTVYRAGLADALNQLWPELEPHLSWYNPSWDKCARLIRTVAQAFNERPWPAQEFFRIFEDESLFSRALDEIERAYRGSRYIRQLKADVASGQLMATEGQRRILARM